MHTNYRVFSDLVEMGYIPCKDVDAFRDLLAGDGIILTKPRVRLMEHLFGSKFRRSNEPVKSNSSMLLSNQVYIWDNEVWITKNAKDTRTLGDYCPVFMRIPIKDTEPLKAYAKLRGTDHII